MEPKTCPHKTCGHTWTPRKAEPKKCPQCQNPLWTSPRPKKARPTVEVVHVPREEWPDSVVEMLDEAMESAAPPPKDSLSEAKARAEELIRQLA